MTKQYSVFNALTAFAIVVLVYFATQLVLAIPLGTVQEGSVWYWLILAVASCAIGVSSWICAKVLHVDYVTATTVNVKPSLSHAVWGCAITVSLIAVMLPVNNWIFDLIESFGLSRPEVDLPMDLVPLLIVGCIIPAVCEELVFRGTIGNGILCGSKNKLLGCVVVGALFSLFHMNPAQTIHQFALGMLLATVCYRSGSVWTSVIVHLFNNLLAVVLSFVIPDEFIVVNEWLFFACGLVALSLCVFGYFSTTTSKAQPTSPKADTTSTFPKVNILFIVAVGVCLLVWIGTLLVE